MRLMVGGRISKNGVARDCWWGLQTETQTRLIGKECRAVDWNRLVFPPRLRSPAFPEFPPGTACNALQGIALGAGCFNPRVSRCRIPAVELNKSLQLLHETASCVNSTHF